MEEVSDFKLEQDDNQNGDKYSRQIKFESKYARQCYDEKDVAKEPGADGHQAAQNRNSSHAAAA